MPVCPYCRELVAGREAQICSACQTPHHAECWQENRGCTVFGCKCAPADEEKLSIPDSVTEEIQPGLRYFIARHGQQFGPYTMEEVRRYLGERRVADTDLVWCEGMPDWVTVTRMFAVQGSSANAQER